MSDVGHEGDRSIRLYIQNDSGNFRIGDQSRQETLDVDLVVVASGYKRNSHHAMMEGLVHLKQSRDNDAKWTVNRDYSVQFKQGSVSADAGVWLQGCNESTHGLSDTLLSILATRGGEMVDSIFGSSEVREGTNRNTANGH